MENSSRESCAPVKGRNGSSRNRLDSRRADFCQPERSASLFNRAARIFGWPCCEEKKRSTSSSDTALRVAGFQRGVWSLSIRRARTPSRKSERAQKLSDMSHSRRKISLRESGLPRLSCWKITLAEVGEPLR